MHVSKKFKRFKEQIKPKPLSETETLISEKEKEKLISGEQENKSNPKPNPLQKSTSSKSISLPQVSSKSHSKASCSELKNDKPKKTSNTENSSKSATNISPKRPLNQTGMFVNGVRSSKISRIGENKSIFSESIFFGEESDPVILEDVKTDPRVSSISSLGLEKKSKPVNSEKSCKNLPQVSHSAESNSNLKKEVTFFEEERERFNNLINQLPLPDSGLEKIEQVEMSLISEGFEQVELWSKETFIQESSIGFDHQILSYLLELQKNLEGKL